MDPTVPQQEAPATFQLVQQPWGVPQWTGLLALVGLTLFGVWKLWEAEHGGSIIPESAADAISSITTAG